MREILHTEAVSKFPLRLAQVALSELKPPLDQGKLYYCCQVKNIT